MFQVQDEHRNQEEDEYEYEDEEEGEGDENRELFFCAERVDIADDTCEFDINQIDEYENEEADVFVPLVSHVISYRETPYNTDPLPGKEKEVGNTHYGRKQTKEVYFQIDISDDDTIIAGLFYGGTKPNWSYTHEQIHEEITSTRAERAVRYGRSSHIKDIQSSSGSGGILNETNVALDKGGKEYSLVSHGDDVSNITDKDEMLYIGEDRGDITNDQPLINGLYVDMYKMDILAAFNLFPPSPPKIVEPKVIPPSPNTRAYVRNKNKKRKIKI